MNFDAMDRETTRAVVQAQLDDLDALVSGTKRKRQPDDDTDQGLAIKSYRTELLFVAHRAGIPEASFAPPVSSSLATKLHATAESLLATGKARGGTHRPTISPRSTVPSRFTNSTEPSVAARREGRPPHRPSAPYHLEINGSDVAVDYSLQTPSHRGSNAGGADEEELTATSGENEEPWTVLREGIEEMLDDEDSQSDSTYEPDDDSVDDEYEYAFTDDEDDADLTEETSVAPRSVTPAARATAMECLICTEKFPSKSLITLPCSHQYCKKCLVTLVTTALANKELFPPRCCQQPVLLSKIQKYLTKTLVTKFKNKELEFATPNRTYCHNEKCSAFIPPLRINKQVGRCTKCRNLTCAMCKKKSHGGFDCPKDEAYQAVVQLGKTNRWMRCYNCNAMVERLYGCNHMTCVCGVSFCYICGGQWTRCKCRGAINGLYGPRP